MNLKARETFGQLFERYPVLESSRKDILNAYDILSKAYKNGKKLMVCGNGGSCADSEHITGELMKGFKLKREVPGEMRAKLEKCCPEHGGLFADNLQGALKTIALTSSSVMFTAFCNDVDADLAFAQQLYGYAEEGDVLLGISTSGTATNVNLALELANALGVTRIGLAKRGAKAEMTRHCDILIAVAADETYSVQELHLPIYHCLCAMLEEEFFGLKD